MRVAAAGTGTRPNADSSRPGSPASTFVFVSAYALGSALLAAWLEIRFPRLGPAGLRQLVLHVVCMCAATQFLFPQLMGQALARDVYLALFGVALPVLTYCLLVGFWTLRFLSDKLAGHLQH